MKRGRAKQSVPEKVKAQYPEFFDEVQSLSVDDLNSRIATCAKCIEITQEAKEADEGLRAAREEVSNMAAPYNEAKKGINLKIKYLYALVKEKGGA